MWIGIIAGWVLGSVTFYTLLVRSAAEPERKECMECHLLDCAECPYVANSQEQLKRAA